MTEDERQAVLALADAFSEQLDEDREALIERFHADARCDRPAESLCDACVRAEARADAVLARGSFVER